ncbi:unnamed protein product [Rangifer tarandus platyrhynchus]|uniref:Uncharacterized protein n=1 Tax=Rangifer tarandus platyrhynchus TaxID=3082113 RepID=A0AC59YCR6_RANTA
MYLNYCQKIQKFVLESIFPFFAKMGQGKNSSNFRIVFLKAGERSVDCKYRSTLQVNDPPVQVPLLKRSP